VPEEAVHQHASSAKREAFAAAFALTSFTVAASISMTLMPIVTSELQDRFGFSSSEIGLLTSVFMVTFAVGAVPMGLLGARWGGRALVAGGILLAGGLTLFAFCGSYPWFLVARLLQGLGASGFVPFGNALIAQNVRRRYQDRALGVFGCGTGVGTLAALLIMPSINTAGGYRAVFLTTAAIAVAFMLVAVGNRVVRSRPEDVGADVSFGGLMRGIAAIALNRRLFLLIMVNLGVTASVVGVLTWTPLFLHDQRGAGLAVAAYLTAGFGAAQILGSIGGAVAMNRWGKSFVLSVGTIVLLLAVALMPFAPGVVTVFSCVVVAGFITMALLPAVLGSIPEIVPGLEQVGPAGGFLNLTNLMSTLLAPWVFGVLLDAYGTDVGRRGYLWGYEFLAAFAVVGATGGVVYAVSSRRARWGSARSREMAGD